VGHIWSPALSNSPCRLKNKAVNGSRLPPWLWLIEGPDRSGSVHEKIRIFDEASYQTKKNKKYLAEFMG